MLDFGATPPCSLSFSSQVFLRLLLHSGTPERSCDFVWAHDGYSYPILPAPWDMQRVRDWFRLGACLEAAVHPRVGSSHARRGRASWISVLWRRADLADRVARSELWMN